MTRFRLLRPIAVPRISGAVAATGDLSAATGGGGTVDWDAAYTTALAAARGAGATLYVDPANTTGVAMPPKGGNPALKEADLADIVAYLRTLEK